MPPLQSVSACSSAEAIEGLLNLIHAQTPIVDVTWGNGMFWKGSPRRVFGFDCEQARAASVRADFQHLPLQDASIPTLIFDPPFHPTDSHTSEWGRFRTMGRTDKDLKRLFQSALRECWRATSRHLLVKCQGYIHNHVPQWMPLWAIEVCGEPFEWLVTTRGKRVSGRWQAPRSLYRNHADYLVFDKRGNHR